jgi:hypothetical protein
MAPQTNIPIEAITVDDLNKINSVLLDALCIKNIHSNDSVFSYKEDLINTFSELIKKILFQSPDISDDSTLTVINLLQKINMQKEILEMIKSKASAEDLIIASERLSKKSQSAFELK